MGVFVISVKQQILRLLGVFAQVYPEEMVNYSERLVDVYVRTLKSEVST